MDIAGWASRLLEAERSGFRIPALSSSGTGATMQDAYGIRDDLLTRTGARIVGAVVALHAADRIPVFGLLTDAMLVEPGDPFRAEDFSRPAVVPHLAFVIGESLPAHDIGTFDVLRATEAVVGAVEIVDSRFEGPALALDLTAENAGTARVVMGSSWVPPRRCRNLDLVGCLVESAGEVVASGAGAAALGHPASAAARSAADYARRGGSLGPGSVLLSGGLTGPVALSGSLAVTFAHFGAVHLELDGGVT